MAVIGAGMIERGRELRRRFGTYTSYSIGCAIVWGIILAVVWAEADEATRRTYALLFGGWVIGWLSATIARVIYPPPKKWETR